MEITFDEIGDKVPGKWHVIPASMRQHIDEEFLDCFVDNLQKTLHCADKMEAMKSTQFDMGCAGWAEALEATCYDMDVPGIYEYWDSLKWHESDAFDAELSEMANDLFKSRGIEIDLGS